MKTKDNEMSPVFGEAIAFYKVRINSAASRSFVVFHRFEVTVKTLGQIIGRWDRSNLHTVDISAIIDIIGIWEPQWADDRIYILRKHPALDLLSPNELGKGLELEDEEDQSLKDWEESAGEGRSRIELLR
jgi:hypothetical protein